MFIKVVYEQTVIASEARQSRGYGIASSLVLLAMTGKACMRLKPYMMEELLWTINM